MSLMFESGVAGSDEQLKFPGDTVLIEQVKKLTVTDADQFYPN